MAVGRASQDLSAPTPQLPNHSPATNFAAAISTARPPVPNPPLPSALRPYLLTRLESHASQFFPPPPPPRAGCLSRFFARSPALLFCPAVMRRDSGKLDDSLGLSHHWRHELFLGTARGESGPLDGGLGTGWFGLAARRRSRLEAQILLRLEGRVIMDSKYRPHSLDALSWGCLVSRCGATADEGGAAD